jgi:16S rRNA (guanine(966)-N(2))-methyltransferase RsmD
MRIIAGQFRSRVLRAPAGMNTRPTSDRLRETLFNVLTPRIAGARFADLYAGSGAVGIEALSRGASFVLFAEKAPPAIAAIHANLATLKITTGFQIEARGVARALTSIAPPADILFLDPPYEAAAEYTATLDHIARAHESILAPNAIVVAEHNRKHSLPESFGTLTRNRVLEQGDAALSFYAMGQ